MTGGNSMASSATTIRIFVAEIAGSGRYRAVLGNGTDLIKSSRQPPLPKMILRQLYGE